MEPHRVVPGHFPAVLEVPDLFQAQLRVERSECRLRVMRGNPEPLVELWQELLQPRIPHLAQTSDAVNRQLSCFSSRYMNLLAVFQI